MVPYGERRMPRRPGNFSRSKKSAMVDGFWSAKRSVRYAYMVEYTISPTPHSDSIPGR